jgi:hypothetical protein
VACAVAVALPAPFYIVSSTNRVRDPVSHTSDVFAPLQKRSSCFETCGTVCYSQKTINAAVAAGYKLYKEKKENGNYPHTENNYEGFDFNVTGPYQEYPVMSSFVAYNGGSPGADRVVFNTKGLLAGVVTHTGASGNDFVQCTA